MDNNSIWGEGSVKIDGGILEIVLRIGDLEAIPLRPGPYSVLNPTNLWPRHGAGAA